MAYQNVGTPRFYVNLLEWEDSIGYREIDDINRTLPVRQQGHGATYYSSGVEGEWTANSFVAFLGHDIHSSTYNNVYIYKDDIFHEFHTQSFPDKVLVNSEGGQNADSPYNGFSILGFNGDGLSTFGIVIQGGANVGSAIVGTYHDMPHSPDLKLTMKRESLETKHIRSYNGSTFSNSFHSANPMWGQAAPWELWGWDDSPPRKPKLARSGRRVWDMSFNYLSDSQIFPETLSLTRLGEADYSYTPDEHDLFDETLMKDDNFYSRVLHKTVGLPFIFQPDKTDFTNFAICRWDQSSFKLTQVANSVYNIKLKIREVW